MKKFKTWRDPYDAGFSTCRRKEIEINSGLTVFVGCNGAGKSTLLHNIAEVLKKEKIPAMFFDNLRDGGHNAMEKAGHSGNLGFLAGLMTSSEGESLGMNIGSMLGQVRKFLRTGVSEEEVRRRRLTRAFMQAGGQEIEEESEPPKERWLLLDAADSGYSIDNVIDLKEIFELMKEDAEQEGVELYILISANEYELANGEQCFDVNEGKYLTFKDYDDYKQFILKTRKKKDKRYAKLR